MNQVFVLRLLGDRIVSRRLFVLFAIVANTPALVGQELPIGQRIRVTFQDSSSNVDRVDSANANRIWMGSSPHPIDLGQVTRIEVSRGRKPKWLLGAGLGAAAGLLTGFVLKGVIETYTESENEQAITALYLGAGAAGGALIGLGVSAALARERWEAVSASRWSASHGRPRLATAARWQLGWRFHY